ncbi:MAG: DUF427 domain-containing protein [Actinobacteria bacterium]|nr:DUF427 domain-containing protein [Actinomycetota bacterium]
MPKVVYGSTVIAQSDDTVVVEGNHYFPRETVKAEFLRPSETHTFCGWKGQAGYYTIEVDGRQVEDAAWFYPEPMRAARNITGHVAFYKDKVTVEA